MVGHELHKVAVTGGDIDAGARSAMTLRERGDDIVGLALRSTDDLYSQCVEELQNDGDLRRERVRDNLYPVVSDTGRFI